MSGDGQPVHPGGKFLRSRSLTAGGKRKIATFDSSTWKLNSDVGAAKGCDYFRLLHIPVSSLYSHWM
ncbi:hypothetical protein [Pseudomonas frederiksbergensis]|uniref:hypothetical protein n=1 Tax=Pseudomonas frederiksbergensis TaxID=104087 RepID=UPI003D249F4F